MTLSPTHAPCLFADSCAPVCMHDVLCGAPTAARQGTQGHLDRGHPRIIRTLQGATLMEQKTETDGFCNLIVFCFFFVAGHHHRCRISSCHTHTTASTQPTKQPSSTGEEPDDFVRCDGHRRGFIFCCMLNDTSFFDPLLHPTISLPPPLPSLGAPAEFFCLLKADVWIGLGWVALRRGYKSTW